MEKQKFDRMKKILGILVLVFLVVPLTTVSASPYHDDRSLHDENLGFPHIIEQSKTMLSLLMEVSGTQLIHTVRLTQLDKDLINIELKLLFR